MAVVCLTANFLRAQTNLSPVSGSNSVSGISTNEPGLVVRTQAQWEAEAKQMAAEGKVNLTLNLIASSPQKITGKEGWLDGEFIKIDNTPLMLYLKSPRNLLSFQVQDRDGNYYNNCIVNRKTPALRELMKLKRGDSVRLKGKVMDLIPPNVDSEDGLLWLQVDSIEIMESATDKK
ncbi:MAG TPA: hypothetical protein VHG71_07395 [Verrucomicrobiae bacterium]|nr:hypothetical protein [Verrucomicrobiae bacterium]